MLGYIPINKLLFISDLDTSNRLQRFSDSMQPLKSFKAFSKRVKQGTLQPQMLAVHSFQDHRLSLGQATRLSGLDRWSFIQLLSQHNIPVIDMDEEELEREFATVDKISRRLQESRA